jgi:fluoride exporter
MVYTFLQVGFGGAIGAMLRFGVGLALVRLIGTIAFPLAILSVNVVGSFLMGMCVVWLSLRGMTNLSPLMMTGVLGGFTTFSTFSLEAFTLFERGDLGLAGLYVVLSVVLSILGLVVGVVMTRGLLA